MSKAVKTKNGIYIYQDLQTGRLTPCNNLKKLTELKKHVSYSSVNTWFRRLKNEEPYKRDGYLIHNEHLETSTWKKKEV